MLSPHKFVGGPGTPGVLAVRRQLLDQPRAGGRGWWHRRVREPRGARLPRATRSTERRPARRPSSSRSAPAGLSAQGGSGRRCHPGPRVRLRPPRHPDVGTTCQRSRSSATSTPNGCRSCPSSSIDPAVATCTTTRSWRCSTTSSAIQARGGCSCAGPYGHRLLGHRRRALPRVRTRHHRRVRRHQAGLGARQLQLLHRRRGLRVHRQGRSAFVARHGHHFLADYTFDPDTGLWRHRVEPSEAPLRLVELGYDDQTGFSPSPGHRVEPTSSSFAPTSPRLTDCLAERRSDVAGDSAHVTDDFDALRWFELPADCLVTTSD